MDWARLFWRLAHGACHVLPAQADRLTLTEVGLLLDDNTRRPRPASGGAPIDPWSVADFIARRRAMTPRQRLGQAKDV